MAKFDRGLLGAIERVMLVIIFVLEFTGLAQGLKGWLMTQFERMVI